MILRFSQTGVLWCGKGGGSGGGGGEGVSGSGWRWSTELVESLSMLPLSSCLAMLRLSWLREEQDSLSEEGLVGASIRKSEIYEYSLQEGS